MNPFEWTFLQWVAWGWITCMVLVVIGFILGDFFSYLKERRQELRLSRAVRPYQDHQWMPDGFLSERGESDLHDWCLAAEKAAEVGWISDPDEYERWVDAGCSWAALHAAWKQKAPEDLERWDGGAAA